MIITHIFCLTVPNNSVSHRSGGGSRRNGSLHGSRTGGSGFLFPKMQQIQGRTAPSQSAPVMDDLIAMATRPHKDESTHGHRHRLPLKKSKIVWRDIKALADDPDHPWNPRLQHLASGMDLGWAAAVPIRNNGEKQGIVIYMARAGVDLGK